MSEMQSRQVRNDLPDVISLDQLPDAPMAKQAAPDVIDINSFPDSISIDSLPDTQPAQPQASGMMEGLGSALVRGYQDKSVQDGLAEKFNLIGYKNAIENGGKLEEFLDVMQSGKATPAQLDMFRRNVPFSSPEWRAAEVARVTNELGKLDLSIKDAEATRANYGAKSAPYLALQQANEQAKKDGRPIMGTLENLWDNPAGIPEFLAEGAYSTGRPIAGAIAAGLALRRGQAAPIVQTLGPIAASMGITGFDSYKSQVSEMVEKKAREGGIDLRKNPEMLNPLLTDANFIEAVKTDALKAGLNDAAWAGISTWLGMTPKIKGIWQPVVQSVAEGATDVSKQLVIDGKVSDPQSVIMSTVAGAAFEAPGYGIGRAVGAFSPSAPATATPAAQPQAQAQTQAAPDVIDVNTLPDAPSVAGETVEPAAAAPAPAAPVQPAAPAQPEAAAPAPVQPAQPEAPAPVTTPTASQATGPDNSDAAYEARAAEWRARVEAQRAAAAAAAQEQTPAPVQPAPVEQPAPATPAAEQSAPVVPATEKVEPAPELPGPDATEEEKSAWADATIAWRKKYGDTHFESGNPRPVDYIPGTPEFESRVARQRAEREAAQQPAPAQTPAPAVEAAQPAAPQAEATPAAEAKPAPAQPAAQTEIPGTEGTFNLTGEQVAAPRDTAQDTTAEMPIGETRDNPLVTEARARLAKLEAAGKGDSEQAAALRRTIQRESKPTAPAQTQAAPAPTAEPAAPQAQANPEPATAPAAEQPKAQPAPAQPQAEQPKKPQPRQKKPDPTTGEPAAVTLARRRIENPKTNPSRYTQAVRTLDQYENDKKLRAYDPTVELDKVSDEALTEFLEAHDAMVESQGADADQEKYADRVSRYTERRLGTSNQYGDLLADMRDLSKRGIGLPVLPKWMKMDSGRTFSDIIRSKIPFALTIPPLLKADEARAKTDGEYRQDIKKQFEGMVETYAQALADLGWTQVDPATAGWDELVDIVSRAANGETLAPQGGVQGRPNKTNPRLYSTDPNANAEPAADPNAPVNDPNEADTREPEPSDEDKQTALDMEVEYGEPRYDAEPSPADQAVLDAAADGAPTEQSILDALDKAAREALDPKNVNEIFTAGPRIIAAVTWMTARQIQKGVVSFAKWAADTARKFPSLKGSLKSIWAHAQEIAKRPMDYIRFRALDSIADKVWQNAARNKGSATLRKIANIVFAKAGPDADASENDIPTRVNLVRTQFSNIYAGIMERFAAEFADMTPEQRRQWDADFRKAVIEGTTPSDPKVAKAVKDFRNLMRDMLEYQRAAGIEMGDQGGNYFPRNYDPDAVEANRDGFIKAAMEMYRKRDERLLKKAIDDVRRAEKERPAERKEADRKFGRKIKSDAEYQQEAAEWAQEKIAALEAEHAAKDDDFYKQKAEDWATAITHGDVLGLTLFKATEGKVTSDSTDARTFNNDEAALADEFLKKNIDDIMLGYVDGAVRGAELARVFGQDGKKFEQMMNQLSKEGVDAETIKETRRLVQKALGVGREQSSQATAVFFDWVNVVLAGAFLGKTFMYNLVLEPISFGIRTGNAYLALKSMADTWKYALAEIANPSPAVRQRIEAKYGSQKAFAKAVTETVGEQVGLIQNEMERSYFNAHWDYSAGEKGSRLAKWISQRIYRANLMSATEKAKVQASIGIARLALRDNARFFTGDAPIQKLFKALGIDASADKSAAVILRENGVPDADHKAFAAWVAGLEGKTDAEWQAAVMDPKDPMAKHYRRALQRMSLGMSIKTNPALKMEMSDNIMGRLMMQLMNYSYAYSNLVKDRMYSMAAATVSKDASKIDRLRYAAPLLVGAPLAILGAAASKALIAALWPSDDEEERRKKTSDTRKAFDYASFAGMFGPKVEYLFKSFERGQAPGGPVGETIFRGGQAAFAAAGDPDSEKKAYNAKKQLYNSTVKPLVTGAGAAAHPFFGFLGNAAVNNQDVRESVTGEKPRR